MKFRESNIIDRLTGYFDHVYQLRNVFVFAWESDYFGITKNTNYVYEVEVKISVADFKNDGKHKKEKFRHFQFADQEMVTIPKPEQVISGWHIPLDQRKGLGICPLIYRRNKLPNRFYYIVPDTISDKVKPLIPKYAGLLKINEYGHISQVKPAKFLHKRVLLSDRDFMKVLLDKYYYKCQKLMVENLSLKHDIKIIRYYEEPDMIKPESEQLKLV